MRMPRVIVNGSDPRLMIGTRISPWVTSPNFAWFRDRFENGIFAKKRPNVINLDFIDEFDWADPVISMNG